MASIARLAWSAIQQRQTMFSARLAGDADEAGFSSTTVPRHDDETDVSARPTLLADDEASIEVLLAAAACVAVEGEVADSKRGGPQSRIEPPFVDVDAGMPVAAGFPDRRIGPGPMSEGLTLAILRLTAGVSLLYAVAAWFGGPR